MSKIGDYSKLTQVTVRMLRYYDEAGLLKPAKIDSWTGYRMYSAEQIPVLNKIIYLRDSGFQVSEIAKALRCKNHHTIMEQLDKKYKEIESSIEAAREKQRKITLARQALMYGTSEMHYQISVKAIPACQVLSIRKVIPTYYGEGALWEEMSSFASQNNLAISGTTFSIYHDVEYKEQNVDVEICAPIEKNVQTAAPFCIRTTEPVPFMACSM